MNDQRRKIGDLDKELKNANWQIQNLTTLSLEKDVAIEKLTKKLSKATQ